jgi:hypothetical protein
MGHPFAGDRVLINLFRTVAALATRPPVIETVSIDRHHFTGFDDCGVFAQAPFVQTHVDVWRSEANQR